MNGTVEAAPITETVTGAAIGMTAEAMTFMVIAFAIVIVVLVFSVYVNFRYGGKQVFAKHPKLHYNQKH